MRKINRGKRERERERDKNAIHEDDSVNDSAGIIVTGRVAVIMGGEQIIQLLSVRCTMTLVRCCVSFLIDNTRIFHSYKSATARRLWPFLHNEMNVIINARCQPYF